MQDTIAAIATPPGRGGIAVLRVSGPDAIKITSEIFSARGNKALGDMPGYTVAYGDIADSGEILDDCILTLFRAPRSYTGEDVCEISCHGGDYISRRILSALIKAGARPALPGEFTKRAFLSGKMDLTRAESVIELIDAEGEQAMRLAHMAREGRTERIFDGIADTLISVAAAIGAYADYPDEDLGEADPVELAGQISAEIEKLDMLTSGYDAGQIIRRGVRTAIVGRPNVGKSSVMNRLAGTRRSIVSSIPGTTRDVVETDIFIDGVRFILSDTAGLRESADEIEQIGVSLSYEKMAGADIILCVLDSSAPLTEEDAALIKSLDGRKSVVALNKQDRDIVLTPADFPKGTNTVAISAETGAGMDDLTAALSAVCALPGTSDAMLIANSRQLDCALRAKASLEEAITALSLGVTLDAVSVLIDAALSPLLEITGRTVGEAVIAELFKNFCVGK